MYCGRERKRLVAQSTAGERGQAGRTGQGDRIWSARYYARREVFQYWLEHVDASLDAAKSALGIASVDRSEIEALCRQLLAENPHVVQQFRDGNTKALGALMGQAKKKNPNADPRLVRELCEKFIAEA